MNKRQEKVLVATLCGLVIAVTAGFVVQPVMAAGYDVGQPAQVSRVAPWDVLQVRKWPASYSRKVGSFGPGTPVWVERCIEVAKSSDWCLVDNDETRGWVNSRYLSPLGGRDI
ncbi:SH3 domain-containing protein [Devosia sp. BK]|uniref:SH3 domain-containing protein n=1 Tax=Devosia sp. BK TaxID=2871706 RepID=UPI00293B5845|nr:SH3 domain-containing protein [Devosia sp. BK]MDV3251597.1 SH3 domain-containing protein [Devosia sp. BK]